MEHLTYVQLHGHRYVCVNPHGVDQLVHEWSDLAAGASDPPTNRAQKASSHVESLSLVSARPIVPLLVPKRRCPWQSNPQVELVKGVFEGCPRGDGEEPSPVGVPSHYDVRAAVFADSEATSSSMVLEVKQVRWWLV